MTEHTVTNKTATSYNNILFLLNSAFRNIRRNMVLFLICLILPALVVVFMHRSKTDIYRASFTVAYEELVRKIYGDRIGKINALVAQQNYEKLSALLGISPSAAKAIHSIEGKNILGQELDKDLNTDKIPFVVVIYVTDTSIFNELQTGLVSFLGSGSPYLASKKAIKNQEVDEELAYVKRQISYIDSLERRMGTGSAGAAPNIQSGSKSLYEFSYELYKKKQELERKKVMPENLQVIDDILVPTKVSQSILKPALLSLIFGLFIYMVLMVLIIPAVKYDRR